LVNSQGNVNSKWSEARGRGLWGQKSRGSPIDGNPREFLLHIAVTRGKGGVSLIGKEEKDEKKEPPEETNSSALTFEGGMVSCR